MIPGDSTPKQHGLMGRMSHSGGHHPWGSRDYLEGIPCKALSCPVNDKRGKCGSPPAAKLNAAGQCETLLEFKARPVPVKPPRCRICGGLVEKKGYQQMTARNPAL
jgi:hypothetical protein